MQIEKSEKWHVIWTHISTSPNDIDRQKGLPGYENIVIEFSIAMIKQHNQKQFVEGVYLAQVSEAKVYHGMAEGSEGNSRDGGGTESWELIF